MKNIKKILNRFGVSDQANTVESGVCNLPDPGESTP
jgi:hypothetical protein